jgi:hypothetical protein
VRHSVNSTRRYFVPIRLFAAATLHGTTINAYGIISSHLANRGAPRWRPKKPGGPWAIEVCHPSGHRTRRNGDED